jgi:hypothetical protein
MNVRPEEGHVGPEHVVLNMKPVEDKKKDV